MRMSDKQVISTILEIIFKRRKLVQPQSGQTETVPFSALPMTQTRQHMDKIERMVSKGQAIHMILPAYPGKSPNRDKTLSKLPDLSEKHSIDNLGELCREISEVYPPGAKICICSDGYVFSDLVRIPDSDVHAYTEAIKDYYQLHYPAHFEFFDIKDAVPQLSCLDAMREELMVCHGESLVTLTDKARAEKETKSMYQGITRFLFEDFCGLNEFAEHSKTQIQKTAKRLSLRVIQRSNAWSDLLEDIYPDSLRLSIHPQFDESAKIGIHMAQTDDCWRTPWHSVALKQGDQIRLHKRSYIDENKHRLIFSGGVPCHYQQVSYTGEVAHA